MNTKTREILERVATVLNLFLKWTKNDTTLIFRFALLYGANSGVNGLCKLFTVEIASLRIYEIWSNKRKPLFRIRRRGFLLFPAMR
jgi:hypothetical protein